MVIHEQDWGKSPFPAEGKRFGKPEAMTPGRVISPVFCMKLNLSVPFPIWLSLERKPFLSREKKNICSDISVVRDEISI